MRHDDDHLYVWFLVFGICLITVLVLVSWKPEKIIPLAYGEEPCLRATTGYYIRNYPPQGANLNHRPAEWGTCYPFPPYLEP